MFACSASKAEAGTLFRQRVWTMCHLQQDIMPVMFRPVGTVSKTSDIWSKLDYTGGMKCHIENSIALDQSIIYVDNSCALLLSKRDSL